MRKLKGTITSQHMHKTVVVRVDTLKKHPKYQKFYRASRTFKAHDEKNEYRVGDIVSLKEGRPLSKEKRWYVVQVLKRPMRDENVSEPAEQENRPTAQ